VLLKHSISLQSVFPESQAEMAQALYMNHSSHLLMHNELQAPMYRRVICVVCCHTNNIMPNLRLSQQWRWSSSSSGIWCHAAGSVILTFPKDCIAFIFKGSWRQYNPSNCLASQLDRQGSSYPLTGPEAALGISTMVGRRWSGDWWIGYMHSNGSSSMDKGKLRACLKELLLKELENYSAWV
jgi:hypothetical protein